MLQGVSKLGRELDRQHVSVVKKGNHCSLLLSSNTSYLPTLVLDGCGAPDSTYPSERLKRFPPGS